MAASSFAADRVELVKNFARSGENPSGKMIIAADENFYGTTKNGGTNNFGTIFRFDATTATIATLVSFGSSTGKYPNGELLDGGDGYLYGTAKQGGTGDFGTIFRFKITDSTLTKLAQFDSANSGKFPLGGLVKIGTRYYGVASEGGSSSCGTVFKVTPVSGTTNWDLGAFAAFTGAADGKKPWGTLVDSGGGALIGTTELGGSATDKGCVFKIATSGATVGVLQLLKAFSGGAAEGANPRAGFWKSKADGLFYGTTYTGGSANVGTVFRINSLGAEFQVVAHMDGAKGSKPLCSLIEPPTADGFLYGTCSEGGTNGSGSVFKVSRDSIASQINSANVSSFNNSDGRVPLAGLVFGANGLAYGTTEQGGFGGLGAIFHVTSGISLRNEASFISSEGSFLRAALTSAPDGAMIGTSFEGGSNGDGSIFRLAPDGTFATLVNFTGADGANPYGPVIALADGTMYGTTYKGGSNQRGTFFRLTADGTIEPLIKFGGTATDPKGTNPRGALVRSGSDFFGVTEKGGGSDKGTVFKITVNPIGSTVSATLTTLLEFNTSNGEFPFGGLTDGGDGFYYGTTARGGVNGFGTFFKISAAGIHTTLTDFTSANPVPSSTLVKAASSVTFYGVSDPTSVEPAVGTGFGTVFQLTSAGVLTTLHTFTGSSTTDGRNPRGLTLIAPNTLAGVTYGGGGTLFTMPTSPSTPATIYRFDDNFVGDVKASRPEAAPTLGLDGAIYGTAQKSNLGGGAVFRLLNGPVSAVTSVTETAPNFAIARGLVNTNGNSEQVTFEYSTSSSFTSAATTSPQTFSGTTTQPISADLVNLTAATPYFVRIKAGTRTGSTFVFGAPLSTTGASSSVGARVATVLGKVNPNGRETSVAIQYGTSVSYGSTVQFGSIGNGSTPVVIESTLSNLQPLTLYYYRIVSTNGAGTSNGEAAVFTTGNNSIPTAPDLFGASTSLTAQILIPLPPGLDPDMDTLTLAIKDQPSFGIATIVANNAILYTPHAGFKGSDSFTYSVTDPALARAIGNVTIRNPFPSLKGKYLTYLTNVTGEPIGSLKLTISATGSFTGTLSSGGSFAIKGVFDPTTGDRAGTPTITIKRPGKTTLILTLHIDTHSENGALSGSVNDGVTTSQFLDDARLVSTKTSPHAGKYTVWLRPSATPGLPPGNGWATLTIATTGACKMAGKLSDGTAFSTAPTLRTTNTVLISVPLFTTQPATGRGYLSGELSFLDKPGSDADGDFKWKRGPQPKSLFYPLGFGPEQIAVVVSRHTPLIVPVGLHNLHLTQGELPGTSTNLPLPFLFAAPSSKGISKPIIASLNEPEKVKFTANFKTGTFSGTFVHPAVGAKKPRAFSGVIFQKQNTAVGVFLGTSTSGVAEIDLQ